MGDWDRGLVGQRQVLILAWETMRRASDRENEGLAGKGRPSTKSESKKRAPVTRLFLPSHSRAGGNPLNYLQ